MNTSYTEEQRDMLLESKVQGMRYSVEVGFEEVFSTNVLLALWEFVQEIEIKDFQLYAFEPNQFVEGGVKKLKGHLVKKFGRTQFILD